jgi:hypothetical protein
MLMHARAQPSQEPPQTKPAGGTERASELWRLPIPAANMATAFGTDFASATVAGGAGNACGGAIATSNPMGSQIESNRTSIFFQSSNSRSSKCKPQQNK